MDANRLIVAGDRSEPTGEAPPAAVGPRPLLGRYSPIGREQESATGKIFDAEDVTGGGTRVRLKLVSPKVLPSTSWLERAQRELKQLGRVPSAKVHKVLDQGRAETGELVVVQEALGDAVGLDELVRRNGALSPPRALALVQQIAEALIEAQKLGVIHRDVAPQNILVSDGDQVRVTDFTLAAPINDKVFGTAGYISPEQAEGKVPDQRSSIYSLAAVMYFALTGSSPFEGDADEQIKQHLEAVPTAPSAKRAGLPGELDKVILRGLDKSPSRRHLTIKQLVTELEQAAKDAADPGATRSSRGQKREPASTMLGIPSPFVTGGGQSTPQAKTTMMAAVTPEEVAAAKAAAPPAPAPAPAPAPVPPTPVPAPPAAVERIVGAPSVEVAPPRAKAITPLPVPSSTRQPIIEPRPAPEPVAVARPAPRAGAVAASPERSALAPVAPPKVADTPPVAAKKPMPIDKPTDPEIDDSATIPFEKHAVAAIIADASPSGPVPAPVGAPPEPVAAPPPPVAAAPAPAPAPRKERAPKPAPAAGGGGGKGGFRETAWFKRGEIEEEIARRQAEVAQSDDPLAPAGTTGEHKAFEDSDLSREDVNRLSLRTGATQTMAQIKPPSAQPIKGERMNEDDMLAEIDNSKKRLLVAGIIVAIVAIAVVLYFVFGRGTAKASIESPTPALARASLSSLAPLDPADAV